MTATRLIITSSLLVSLMGCAKEYSYIPPSTPEGQACVAGCQTSQSDCRRNEDRRALAATERCEVDAERREEQCTHDAAIEYTACLLYAKTDQERLACQKKDCSQVTCNNSGNYGQCDKDYRVCFQSCGGRIEILE